MAHKSPVELLTQARNQRAALTASLPGLTDAASAAQARRAEVTADRERLEGDGLIGVVNEATVTKAITAEQTAIEEERRASASLRKAKADLLNLDAAIARLQVDAYALRLGHYRNEQIRLATELHAALVVAAKINDQLDRLYAEAEAEFPPTVVKAPATRGYPVAAGLTNWAWRELRHNPHATHGGRLGGLRQEIEDLRNPPKPRQRATPPKPPTRVTGNGPWYSLPEAQ